MEGDDPAAALVMPNLPDLSTLPIGGYSHNASSFNLTDYSATTSASRVSKSSHIIFEPHPDEGGLGIVDARM